MVPGLEGIARGREVVEPGVRGSEDEDDKAELDDPSYDIGVESDSESELSMRKKPLSTGEAAAGLISLLLKMAVGGVKLGDWVLSIAVVVVDAVKVMVGVRLRVVGSSVVHVVCVCVCCVGVK